ncbi:MAG: Uncharacterised protein [Halieaceae bacterium]|nr:MAG: Uncharacterised protein [Halieaceae bacterium]
MLAANMAASMKGEPVPKSTSKPTCFRPFRKVTMEIMKPTIHIYSGTQRAALARASSAVNTSASTLL